jgi:hypothetical protein
MLGDLAHVFCRTDSEEKSLASVYADSTSGYWGNGMCGLPAHAHSSRLCLVLHVWRFRALCWAVTHLHTCLPPSTCGNSGACCLPPLVFFLLACRWDSVDTCAQLWVGKLLLKAQACRLGGGVAGLLGLLLCCWHWLQYSCSGGSCSIKGFRSHWVQLVVLVRLPGSCQCSSPS